MTKTLEKNINELDINQLLLHFHEYLTNFSDISQDDIGIKAIRTVVTELVKLKADAVWEHYQ